MREALLLGADIVGGIPWIERDEAARRAHTDLCFALAKAFDKDLHFVCDDTTDPASRTLEHLARKTIRENYENRVAATQCTALAFYDDAYAAEVVARTKAAGITVFSNAHVSLVTTEPGREPYPARAHPRARTPGRGRPGRAARRMTSTTGITLSVRNDMLEVAGVSWRTSAGFAWEPEQVLPMVSSVPARALGLRRYGLNVGSEANLVVLDAATWHQALQFQAVKKAVVLRGRALAQTVQTVKLNI